MINYRRFFKSFHYAVLGIHYAFKSGQNIRFHIFAGLVVVVASLYFHVNAFEMGILGVMILLVIVTEMINTAIEQMVDLITKEHRVEAMVAKDVASGMVLVTAVGSIIVGVLIFAPYVMRMFR